jgi:hypothetical protein
VTRPAQPPLRQLRRRPATLDQQVTISAEAVRYCATYLAWALPLATWLSLTILAPARIAALQDAIRAPFAGILLKRT